MINKFEEGKWYVLKHNPGWEKRISWNNDGKMDFIKDEKPHLCIKAEPVSAAMPNTYRAVFDGAPTTDLWHWDLTDFEEVSIKPGMKLRVKIRPVGATKLQPGDIVTITRIYEDDNFVEHFVELEGLIGHLFNIRLFDILWDYHTKDDKERDGFVRCKNGHLIMVDGKPTAIYKNNKCLLCGSDKDGNNGKTA